MDPLLAGDRAPAPRTLVDVLADVTSRHPDAPALDDTRRVLTYAELTEQARRLAVELAAAGVCRGDRVGVRVPSGTVDLYVAVLGVLARRGGVRARRRRRPPGAGRPRLLGGRGDGRGGAARQVTVPATVRASRRAASDRPGAPCRRCA